MAFLFAQHSRALKAPSELALCIVCLIALVCAEFLTKVGFSATTLHVLCACFCACYVTSFGAGIRMNWPRSGVVATMLDSLYLASHSLLVIVGRVRSSMPCAHKNWKEVIPAAKPRFPQKPKFGITASLLHSVQYIFFIFIMCSIYLPRIHDPCPKGGGGGGFRDLPGPVDRSTWSPADRKHLLSFSNLT